MPLLFDQSQRIRPIQLKFHGDEQRKRSSPLLALNGQVSVHQCHLIVMNKTSVLLATITLLQVKETNDFT